MWGLVRLSLKLLREPGGWRCLKADKGNFFTAIRARDLVQVHSTVLESHDYELVDGDENMSEVKN